MYQVFEKLEFITSNVIHFRMSHESGKSFVSLNDKLYYLVTLLSCNNIISETIMRIHIF